MTNLDNQKSLDARESLEAIKAKMKEEFESYFVAITPFLRRDTGRLNAAIELVGYRMLEEAFKAGQREILEEVARGVGLAVMGTNPKNNLQAIKNYLEQLKSELAEERI